MLFVRSNPLRLLISKGEVKKCEEIQASYLESSIYQVGLNNNWSSLPNEF